MGQQVILQAPASAFVAVRDDGARLHVFGISVRSISSMRRIEISRNRESRCESVCCLLSYNRELTRKTCGAAVAAVSASRRRVVPPCNDHRPAPSSGNGYQQFDSLIHSGRARGPH